MSQRSQQQLLEVVSQRLQPATISGGSTGSTAGVEFLTADADESIRVFSVYIAAKGNANDDGVYAVGRDTDRRRYEVFVPAGESKQVFLDFTGAPWFLPAGESFYVVRTVTFQNARVSLVYDRQKV